MKWVGAHVSAAGGVENAPLEAMKIKAQAFALFLKNQKQWQAPGLSEKNIVQFHQNCNLGRYTPGQILPHTGYLINPGNPEKEGLQKSRAGLLDEMQRCQLLGLGMLNFHPGSHKKMISPEASLDLVAESINGVLEKTHGVTAVIEGTAGQGGQLGSRFEELAYLIAKVEDQTRIGVCLDTCHIFAAGYDIRTSEAWEETMTQFSRIVGLKYLKGMHLNDSKAKLASRIDRHQNLGKGELGKQTFRHIMNDKRLDSIPLILETIDDTLWPKEIRWLYSLAK